MLKSMLNKWFKKDTSSNHEVSLQQSGAVMDFLTTADAFASNIEVEELSFEEFAQHNS